MTDNDNKTCADWYSTSYGHGGFASQRRYPNEELLRFFGRHYFPLPRERRREIRVLEVGCGSGANLWMIAREGFDAYGIDLAPEGISLCNQMLEFWGTQATLTAADMTDVPYPDSHFDVIVDVFSSYCLYEAGFDRFLKEVARLLKMGGRYFSYSPSKESDVFKNPEPSQRLDASTIDGIRRPDAPFAGNLYPWRFITREEYAAALHRHGLSLAYSETLGRTYREGREYFEFVVVGAEKQGITK
jgi:SAM-dependent methyltransferase